MKDKKNLTKDARFQSPQQQTSTGGFTANSDYNEQIARFSQELDHNFGIISAWHKLKGLWNQWKKLFR